MQVCRSLPGRTVEAQSCLAHEERARLLTLSSMSLQCPGTHRIGTSSKSNTTGCDPTRHFVEISYVLAWKRPFNITVGLFVVVSLLRARDSGSKGNSADARYTKKSLAHHCISRGPYSYTRISSSADYRDLLNYMISMPEKHSYPTKRDIMLLL